MLLSFIQKSCSNKNWLKLSKNVCSAHFISTTPHRNSSDNIVRSTYHIENLHPELSLAGYVFKDHGLWKNKPAIVCGATDRTYTFEQLLELSMRVAHGAIAQTGLALERDDIVGVILPNIPEFPAIVFGITEASRVVTFVNPLFTIDEVCRQFENANVKCIFTVPSMLATAQAYQKRTSGYKGTVVVGGENDLPNHVMSFESFVNADHSATLPKMDTDQIAVLPYSSGTTGLPKGVMLTHKNLVANLVQGMHTSTNRFSSPDSPDKHSLVFTIPPFFHIYGFNAILNYNMCSGNGTLSFPRFTPEAFLECIVKYRPSVLSLVPSLLLFLIHHPSVTRDHLSSIKHINVGAAPVSIEAMEKYKMKAQRDVFIMQGYGMTETSPAIILAPLCSPPSKGGSTGHIYPNSEARVVSLTDGTNLGPNQNGELYLRGPQIMKGYLNNPEATKEILDDDGWLRTGDLVYYDEDNYFYIVDRTKELIKVKGNQVSPSELENVILELTDIADVAVSGIADEMAGEIPKAFVVLKENAKLTEADIVDYVKAKVAKYKQLKGGVTFLKAIPRNPSGKILRKDLKAMG